MSEQSLEDFLKEWDEENEDDQAVLSSMQFEVL